MNVQTRIIDAAQGACRLVGDEKKRIVGYGSVFWNGSPGTEYDIYGDGYLFERILPGAFDRAIREDDVRGLVNHNVDRIIGRTPLTMRLGVDATGLEYEIDPPSFAVDIVESIQRKDVTGASFSFIPTDSNPVRREGGRRILEITGVQLFDTGPVTFPAYRGASAGIRSMGEPDMDLRRRIEAEEARLSKRLRARRLRLLEIS